MAAALAVAGLMLSGSTALAQNGKGDTPAATNYPALDLSYGARQVLRLERAKISDDTIIAYINNSPIPFGLDAHAIVYLGQQGVANDVIVAMLHKPPTVTYVPPVVPAAVPPTANTAVIPYTTAVTVPSPVYYYDDDGGYYPYYDYDPYPVIGFGWGWGGYGWHGGGGAHFSGGFHGGAGGFHGGGGHR